MDLIDRDALLRRFQEEICSAECEMNAVCEEPCDACMLILEATKVDAVIPVRCKDCGFYDMHYTEDGESIPLCRNTDSYVNPNHYCSMSEWKG